MNHRLIHLLEGAVVTNLRDVQRVEAFRQG